MFRINYNTLFIIILPFYQYTCSIDGRWLKAIAQSQSTRTWQLTSSIFSRTKRCSEWIDAKVQLSLLLDNWFIWTILTNLLPVRLIHPCQARHRRRQQQPKLHFHEQLSLRYLIHLQQNFYQPERWIWKKIKKPKCRLSRWTKNREHGK